MKTFKMMKIAEQTGKNYKANDLHYSQVKGFTQRDRETPWPASAFNSLNELLEVDEWEEVKEPVTWQEAIQAWLDGKKIYCILDGETYEYADDDVLSDNYDFGVGKDEMVLGKWFIGGEQ